MALKDWKKQKYLKYHWIRKDMTMNLGKYVYADDNGNPTFVIHSDIKPKDNRIIEANWPQNFWKEFKTKSQALKFAKSYMRTH